MRKKAFLFSIASLCLAAFLIIYNLTILPMSPCLKPKYYYLYQREVFFDGIGGRVKILIDYTAEYEGMVIVTPRSLMWSLPIIITLLDYTPSSPIFKGAIIEASKNITAYSNTKDVKITMIPAMIKYNRSSLILWLRGYTYIGKNIWEKVKEGKVLNGTVYVRLPLIINYVTWIGLTYKKTHVIEVSVPILIKYP